jgi:hypothetical protein
VTTELGILILPSGRNFLPPLTCANAEILTFNPIEIIPLPMAPTDRESLPGEVYPKKMSFLWIEFLRL